MSSHNQITVVIDILGKEYRIACSNQEKDALLRAAQHLNEKVNQIKNGGRVVGGEKIVVMAALNLAHELLDQQDAEKNSAKALGQRLAGLKHRVDTVLDECSQLEM
ncbi:MAG: cell division protein ZapA [Gammaproteobacteria bacterium]|nr:cell division protein ZapA [Gammaproteobacteria bacterium]